MSAIPAPTHGREEWTDADFDLADGEHITRADQDDDEEEDEDWDAGMALGRPASSEPQMRIARPLAGPTADEDEGVSTIKAGALQSTVKAGPVPVPVVVEDFEDGFELGSELTQLSLAPTASLTHRSSKNSLEWGDKDQTSSSQSSDAYSTLGLADASEASDLSNPPTDSDPDDDDDADDDDLDGIVFPADIFDSTGGMHHLAAMLAQKRDLVSDDRVKVASPDDEFEQGLIIGDDTDFHPSRLKQAPHMRSHSMPVPRPQSSLRAPSRLRHDRGMSSVVAPRQLPKPSPPQSRTSPSPCPSPTPSTSSFLAAKSNLRSQKSHSGLHPVTPPSNPKKLVRKASLSSLMDTSPTASGFALDSESTAHSRYEESTAASRAKSYRSMGRIMNDWQVPPTRPSTPSTSTAALRLTMPTAGRFKTRPSLSAIFGSPKASSSTLSPPTPQSPSFRTSSPQPIQRPASRLARLSRTLPSNIPSAPPPAPRVLRKPKRQRTYGDGTELDDIDDLPTNRDQESRFRVQPTGYGNRIPGGSYKPGDKNTIRKKMSRRERSESTAPKRPSKFDSAYLKLTGSFSPPRKKKTLASPTQPKKKPMLIRNLGGIGSPKVVGDMKWNPYTLRWEGNDHLLRDFDAVVASTRPALITHLTGSSIGSPVGPSFAAGARRVGNMLFDPAQLCWVSTLPPDEDEPDVFANLADDEEDGDGWDVLKAGSHGGGADPQSSAPSPARSSHTRDSSECSDRGSRASLVYDIDEAFMQRCKIAEERHRVEMKGWKSSLSKQDVFSEPDRSFLYTLRDVAMAVTRK